MALLSKSNVDKRRKGASDPASLLIIEHEKVERLFGEIKAAEEPNEVRGLVAQLDAELTRHTQLEEEVVYPFIRLHVPDGPAMMDEAEREHAEAKATLAKVAALDPSTKDFTSDLARLQKEIEHHVKEEEKKIFPALDKAVSNTDLAVLRGQMEARRMEEMPKPALTKPTPARRTKPAAAAVWVQPHHVQDKRWQVRREGSSRAARVFDTQKEAAAFGRAMAKRAKVEFILAGRDGEIREKDSYGHDPRSVAG